MSWYSQMMKSHELARARNQRMERRLQGERYGHQFVAQTRMAALDKEKRLMEKELERIRKGIHKPPKLNNNVNSKSGHILTITSPTRLSKESMTLTGNAFETRSIDPVYSRDENKLYDAIVFLQNNPSALVPILTAHAQNDAYLDTLQRITPRLPPMTKEVQSHQPFVPRYLQSQNVNSEKADLVNKYTSLLQRYSPVLRKGSPLLKSNRYKNSPRPAKDSPLLGERSGNVTQRSVHSVLPPIERKAEEDKLVPNSDQVNEEGSHDVPDGVNTVDNEVLRHGSNTTHDTTVTIPKPVAKLADDDDKTMQARDNDRTSGESRQVDDKKARQAKPVAPVSGYFDTEMYNADGTLRTVHQMPSPDMAWEEAQKARYIRTKDVMDRDKELSVKEIFEKPAN